MCGLQMPTVTYSAAVLLLVGHVVSGSTSCRSRDGGRPAGSSATVSAAQSGSSPPITRAPRSSCPSDIDIVADSLGEPGGYRSHLHIRADGITEATKSTRPLPDIKIPPDALEKICATISASSVFALQSGYSKPGTLDRGGG